MKKLKSTTHEQLLQARQQGLERARKAETMRPHGKWNRMDVFSWIDPQFDVLASVITSLPFPVIWVGRHEQIKCAAAYYPEVIDAIETVIVYDQAHIRFRGDAVVDMNRVIGAGSLKDALHFTKSRGDGQAVLLFTSEGQWADEQLEEFKLFLEENS